MLKKTIESLVDKDWRLGIADEDVQRWEYWLKIPHCKEAIPIKEVNGEISYFCVHYEKV